MDDQKLIYQFKESEEGFLYIVILVASILVVMLTFFVVTFDNNSRYFQFLIEHSILIFFIALSLRIFWTFLFGRMDVKIFTNKIRINNTDYSYNDIQKWQDTNTDGTLERVLKIQIKDTIINIKENISTIIVLLPIDKQITTEELIHYNQENSKKVEERMKEQFFIKHWPWFLFFVLCVCSSGIGYYFMKKKPKDKIIINSILANSPECRYYSGGRHSDPYYSTALVLKGSEEFHIYKKDDTMINGINEKLWEGDTVRLEILKYDYDVKIAKKRNPLFWDKHFDWNHIDLYGLSYKDTTIIPFVP